jgi:hypothetical protein
LKAGFGEIPKPTVQSGREKVEVQTFNFLMAKRLLNELC